MERSSEAVSLAKLVQSSRGHRMHALWCVMLGLGLRPGEALALQWDAVELDRSPGLVHVRAT